MPKEAKDYTASMATVEERFWPKIEVADSGCWEWRGAISSGYGRIRIEGHTRLAHRWAYEDAYGPVPNGLELDHLCKNTRCVRPSHLEAVSHLANMQRGDLSGNGGSKPHSHCSRGHRWTAVNSAKSHRTGRCCRICKNEAGRRYREDRRRNHG